MLRDDQTTAANLPAASQPLDNAVADFLGANPNPGAAEVAGFLGTFSDNDRVAAATALVTQGVDSATVYTALTQPSHSRWMPALRAVRGVATLMSAAACAFHGARRNNGSFGWGVAWFAMGAAFPVVSPMIALAQGFGQRKAG